jgi:transposase-like protein
MFKGDSDTRKTVLARSSSNCKLQASPLVREGAPYQQTRKFLQVIKEEKLVTGPRWLLTPIQSD